MLSRQSFEAARQRTRESLKNAGIVLNPGDQCDCTAEGRAVS